MKRNYIYIPMMICFCITYCKTPMSITANPSDHTNANGTIGSAKMTSQMPAKNNNVPVKPGTIRLPNDTVQVKQ